MKKIIPGWRAALLAIGVLAILERLVFKLTGDELTPLNQSIDLILTASCLLFMWCLSPYQSFHNRSHLSPNIIVGLLLGSFLRSLLIVLLVTATVNDMDGGLLLISSVFIHPVLTSLTLVILSFHQKIRSCRECQCRPTKHLARPSR